MRSAFCFTDIKVWRFAVPLLLPLTSLRKVQFFFCLLFFLQEKKYGFLLTIFFFEKSTVLFCLLFSYKKKVRLTRKKYGLQEKSKSVFGEEKNHIAA